jgi:hypothetical protein
MPGFMALILISYSFQMYMRAQNTAGRQELPSNDAQGRLPARLGHPHCEAFGVAMDERAAKARSIAKYTMSTVKEPETEHMRKD